MKLAWFRPAPATQVDARHAEAFLAELSRTHRVDVFDDARAHDFVWKHFRDPFDLCLYELGDDRRYDFIRAYVFHYPGVLVLHGTVHVRDAVAVSRLVVVSNAATAEMLAVDVPAARIRVIPPFAVASNGASAAHHTGPVRFGVLDPSRLHVAQRAMQRASEAGATATLLLPPARTDDLDELLRQSDVIVALEWPSSVRPLVPAVLGMSAARPVIVFDTESTADWPALDPQTWQPRGLTDSGPPVAVSIDPRDEEHSLMLAIRRLSADAPLRAQLGTAARRWWEACATPRHAADAWERVLAEAVALRPPQHHELPADLTADGTERAREILAAFDLRVDLFDS